MIKSRLLISLVVAALLGHVATAEQASTTQQGSGTQGTPAAQGGASAPAGAATAPQQDPAPQGQQPTFRGGINFVRVDVVVTEKGQPVTNLSQADFEVREDGKPQTIEQFRLIKVDSTPRPDDAPPREIRNRDDEVAEAARDDVRVFVIFLDDYHTRLASSMSVKRPLTEFVENQIRPNDLIAVMSPLLPVTDLSFTRNKAAVIAAINNFQGRKFRYEARNQFEREYERQPTEVVEQVRNRVSMTALEGLATRLGSIGEGRKSVIYVSEGFTALLPPQMRSADASVPCLSPTQPGCSPAVGSPSVGENNMNEERARWFAQSDVYARMREVFTAFNRNNASIYALDPRGLAGFEYDINESVGPQQDRASLQMTQDTLHSLAEETDGKAIVNRNDLAGGLQQLVRDSSYYYLIGYTSSAPTDGKFHEIKVNVKRRGIEVRGRRGFWSATTEDVARSMTPTPTTPNAIDEALAAHSTPPQASQYVRTWVGTERGENGKTRVTLVWEPVAGPPGARREQPGRVSVLAATGNGDLVYRGRAPEQSASSNFGSFSPGTNARTAAAAGATGAPLPPQRIVFDAPPGPLELRLSVEAAGGGLLDNDVRKLTVPDLTSSDIAISTPRVYRARTARDVQMLANDAAAVPSTTREFSRAERVFIRFDSYAGGTPAVTAALMNRGGQKMSDVPVMPATAGGTHQIDLGLASIPPGEYLVEITVKGATGESKTLVPLRVVS
jgi:VWFA-related protein